MDKTAKIELHRLFLLEGLPEPLTRASSHIQIFDNYIANTRIRLRSVRNPETKDWTWILQQRFPVNENDLAFWKMAEMYLNEEEYNRFKLFEGSEIRKNRYFHEYDGKLFAFDVFLGDLWGLNMTKVEFENIEELQKFVTPPFAYFEVTNDPFFLSENLVGKNFTEVQAEVTRIGAATLVVPEMPDD